MTMAAAATPSRAVAVPVSLLCRRKLLDAIRGIIPSLSQEKLLRGDEKDALLSNHKRRQRLFAPLKCFRLQKHHIGSFVRRHQETKSAHPAHILLPPPSPVDFHATLCECIRNAKRRVTLASLYIGPAADPIQSPAEWELLQALRHAANNNDKKSVQITILLDHNRALRPVAIPKKTLSLTKNGKPKKATEFLTSAQACFEALHGGGSRNDENQSKESSNNKKKIYLFSVLPDFWQSILGSNRIIKNHHHFLPISEAAGVFHIKLYIIDDQLIISGANLSEEYFTNRHDRYLYIQNGGNGLVDCYAQLVHVLCQYAQEYNHGDNSSGDHDDDTTNSGSVMVKRRRIGAQELMHLVSQVLTTTTTTSENDDNNDDYNDLNEDYYNHDNDDDDDDNRTWAYAVPTFQAPLHFQQEQFMRSDVETIRNWIVSAAANNNPTTCATPAAVSLRVASAYLNPTKSFQEMLQRCCNKDNNLDVVHYLTAGRISHGFTSKANKPAATTSSMAGATTTSLPTSTDHHPRRDWIPTLFDATARQVLSSNDNDDKKKNIHLWFYQRPNWTFHAKGLWLCSGTNSINKNQSSSRHRLEIDENDQVLYGCTHGSGNYGARSEYRDLESNLILTFPPRSPLAKQHVEEWNSMCSAAVPWTQEPKQQMSWPLRLIFPWIQSFF